MKGSRRTLAVAALLAATLAACGGGGGGAQEEALEGLPEEAEITAADAPATVELAPGRYRVTFTESCDAFTFTMTQESGPSVDGQPFVYENANPPIRVNFINDVPGGTFVIDQTEAGCDDWSVDLRRITGG
ncbi:MAG: hypothetical protein ACRDGV_07870 [Candidatus Limnocylindria bacterium]